MPKQARLAIVNSKRFVAIGQFWLIKPTITPTFVFVIVIKYPVIYLLSVNICYPDC